LKPTHFWCCFSCIEPWGSKFLGEKKDLLGMKNKFLGKKKPFLAKKPKFQA